MSSKNSQKNPKVGQDVVFLNPATCGIYKSGGTRFKVDPKTGKRTKEVDNELADVVDAYLGGSPSDSIVRVPVAEAMGKKLLVPRYYDSRWNTDFADLRKKQGFDVISLGELRKSGIVTVRGGHGSPSNDRRTGSIPYIKVSDIRSLRVNVNPTNLVTRAVARLFWGGETSGLKPWDVITPNRASSNIGEFALLLPGEEQVVMTKEMFIFSVIGGKDEGWDPFYLFWALCLRGVRRQWQRITLMQTNREDCADRWTEILIPRPKSKDWAAKVSEPFRTYFTTIANAKTAFIEAAKADEFEYIASVTSKDIVEPEAEGPEEEEAEAPNPPPRARATGPDATAEPVPIAVPIPKPPLVKLPVVPAE